MDSGDRTLVVFVFESAASAADAAAVMVMEANIIVNDFMGFILRHVRLAAMLDASRSATVFGR